MKPVTVYNFTQYDISTDRKVRSKRPATLAAIERCCGEIILETAHDVDEARLDGDGFVGIER